MSSANLNDPQVIRDLREHFAHFLRSAGAALGGRANELSRMRDWLRGEQLATWKREVVKREEVYQVARRQFLSAEAEVVNAAHTRGPSRASSMEERIVMDKARRRRDEAEEKLATVKRSLIRIDQECEPLVQTCQSIDLALRDMGEKALNRLERMADRVQEYLDITTAAPLAPAAVGAAPGMTENMSAPETSTPPPTLPDASQGAAPEARSVGAPPAAAPPLESTHAQPER